MAKHRRTTGAEFGHFASRGSSFCLDTWGAGPFVLDVAGRRHRFEDSDRFGPLRLTSRDMPSDRQWGERHPFWAAHRLWVRQGRRLAEDGTCVWQPGRPTIVQKVNKRDGFIVLQGDEDGPVWDADTPEGRAALGAAAVAKEPRP